MLGCDTSKQARLGIVLAAGTGTRFLPATKGLNKHLLAVYDKPMIYYPLSVLLLAGIRDIVIVVSPHAKPLFKKLLGDGQNWGVHLRYVQQAQTAGLADALLQTKAISQGRKICVVLGDNLFYGQGFTGLLHSALQHFDGAQAFVYPVNDVRPFGALRLDDKGRILNIEEKPVEKRAGWVLTGLYLFDECALDLAATLQPSARGELELSDLLKLYLSENALTLQRLGRGFSWMDMGSSDSMLDAASFVCGLEKRQGFKVACLEEIAWRQGWITDAMLYDLGRQMHASAYGRYLLSLLDGSCAAGRS